MRETQRWIPAGFLAVGCGLLLSVAQQDPTPLIRPLSTLPLELQGYRGRDLVISAEEQRVAGMSSYISRVYGRDSTEAFSLYVGYYDHQTQGKTIHSPKNCLPGAGWEPMAASQKALETAAGVVPVNRYLIANKEHRALVYYWYQGRGRVAANEYRVKWELIRDAALRGRTDEALVRIVVPLRSTEADAEAVAELVARDLLPLVGQVVPS
ncbi:MAG: exosortase C-terminal domain/associated protein EpsI [Gemmatimonadales bacterium]